jgi:phosphatidylglycerol:prolipoprotein diacylglycerol transferase
MRPVLTLRLSHFELPSFIALGLLTIVASGVLLYSVRERLITSRTALAALVAGGAVAASLFVARTTAGVPGFSLEPFGLFLTLGLGAGVALSAALLRSAGLDESDKITVLSAALVGALVGARLLYVLGTRAEGGVLGWLAFGRGGLSGYGAAFGAALGARLALGQSERARESSRIWFDAAAPGFLLVVAIARLGCYLGGCDFGHPLAERAPAWLIELGRFAAPGTGAWSAVFSAHALAGDLSPGGRSTPPLHPTQLYEALGALLLLALLLVVRPRQRRHGDVFALGALGYAALRYLVEPLRGDVDRGLLGRLSVTQACSLVSALVVGIWWFRLVTPPKSAE